LNLKIIPGPNLSRHKRPIKVLLNGKNHGFILNEPLTIELDEKSSLQLKNDRLTGSEVIIIQGDTTVEVSVNLLFQKMIIGTFVLFLLTSSVSAFMPDFFSSPYVITLLIVICLIMFASFTFWRKKWIIVKTTHI
jgi:hypothetical protein